MTAHRAAGIALGVLADAALGDPRRGHPVAGFGRLAAALERRTYAPSRARGAAFAAAAVAVPVAAGLAAERSGRRHPAARVGLTALATWAALGGTSLAREGAAMARALEASDVAAARGRLGNLCARDPAHLDADGLARATVESLAENTSDAVVAPLWWGAVAGVPGLAAYRAVNTLDAMIGHRSARYERFGWCAARLDDAANLVPARLSALLAAAAAPAVGGSPPAALTAWRRDAGRHPSPNAGPVEAAFAGALGVTLGGTNRYGDRVEHRGTLGTGPPPAVRDIPRAVRLSRLVGAGGLAITAVTTLAVAAAERRRRSR